MNTRHDKVDIIATGEQLFRARGYHHTGVNEILKAAKISKGSFYNYFESKEDFALQVIRYYGERMEGWIREMLSDESMRPLDRLRAFYEALMTANDAEACQKGCLVYNFLFEVAGLSEPFAAALDTQFARWLPPIEACIAEGQAAGEITTAHSAKELASVLHTSFNGAAGRMKAARSSAPMREVVNTLLAILAT